MAIIVVGGESAAQRPMENLNTSIQAKLQDFERRISRDNFRFAVSNANGLHSTAWAAWHNGNDYYLGARSFLGSMKISLHASGICRVALTERYARSLNVSGMDGPKDRAYVKWRRGIPSENSAICAVSLIFPTAYFQRPEQKGTSKKPMLIVQGSSAAEAIEVGCFYAKGTDERLENAFRKIAVPLLKTGLPSGEAVWIAARETAFDPRLLPNIEQIPSRMNSFDPAGARTAAAKGTPLTGMFWNAPEDGKALQLMELSGIVLHETDTRPSKLTMKLEQSRPTSFP